MCTEQRLATPYHPMSNGLVERCNGTIKSMVKRMTKDWAKRIVFRLLFACREVPQPSIGFLSFDMLYGQTVGESLAILKEL